MVRSQVQVILVRFKLNFSGLVFIIWTCLKWFGPNQNELVLDQNYWTFQNHFGPISRRTRHYFFGPWPFIILKEFTSRSFFILNSPIWLGKKFYCSKGHFPTWFWFHNQPNDQNFFVPTNQGHARRVGKIKELWINWQLSKKPHQKCPYLVWAYSFQLRQM